MVVVGVAGGGAAAVAGAVSATGSVGGAADTGEISAGGGRPARIFATMMALTSRHATNTAAQIAAVDAVSSFFPGPGGSSGTNEERAGGLVQALPLALEELNDPVLVWGDGATEATSAGPRIAMRSSEGVATGPA